MENEKTLNEIVNKLAEAIKSGVLKSTIERRLINNGASTELARKISRIAEIQSIA